ncbi:MAG: peptide chain release factor N(5)-glutamine methyltransferase [Xanthomonadales bacterium]|jgi:release factor glutamine methyltransferase|nr:peptide chain release factor N(5)-glutamine methyltransferase [Xanthomonadales bacterium]
MTARELLLEGRGRLGSALEAEVLLMHVLEVERAWLYANSERPVSATAQQRYADLLERRLAGEPVAYLTGVREFWSLPLQVTPDVLIPRPETELLVEAALQRLPDGEEWRVADLGTGSGAVALAIACERPLCEIHATDISAAALAVARGNSERLAPGRVQFHQGSWFEPLEGSFHLVLSNPPYIREGDPHLETGDCRFEPRLALSPGGDGMDAIRHIASHAVDYLEPGGCLAFEHGFDQGEASRRVLEALSYENIETLRDLESRDRITVGMK